MLDTLIRGAKVLDGSGTPAVLADVGISAGKIEAVGNLELAHAVRVVSADGLIVSPGFIDMHQHSDFSLLIARHAESAIGQGVTTLVTGNCGSSCAPVRDRELVKMSLFGYSSSWGHEVSWRSYGEYLDQVRKPGVAVNVFPLVGHGTVRIAVMGYANRLPTESELGNMKALVAEALQQGAGGFSTGLEYSPGHYADARELLELCKVAADHGAFYSTHIRNRGPDFVIAVEEALSIAASSGLPMQLSHLAPRPYAPAGAFAQVLRLVDEARAKGVRVHFDTLLDLWGPGPVASLLPPWICEAHPRKVVQRLLDSKIRVSIREYFDRPTNYLLRTGGWESLVLVTAPGHKGWVGKSLAEIAAIQGTDDMATVVCDILLAEGEDFGCVWLRHIYVREEDLYELLRQPDCMVMTDGCLSAPYGVMADYTLNPSTYGLTACLLGRYVRDEHVLTLEDAVRRLTSLPAQHLGLKDRGLIKKGMWADLVIFDSGTIQDNTTYEHPDRFPTGIEYVLVNGQVALENGRHSDVLTGQLLRRSLP